MATLVREKVDASQVKRSVVADFDISQEFLKRAEEASLSDKCYSVPSISEVLAFFVTPEIGDLADRLRPTTTLASLD